MPQDSEDRFSKLVFYGVVLCLAYLVFRVFQPFLVPLGWAAVFAVIFFSLNQRLERRWGRTVSASVSTAGVALILVVPLLLLGMLFVREGIEAARNVQAALAAGEYDRFNRAWEWLASHVADQGISIDLPEWVRQSAGRFGEYMASQLGALARNVVVFLLELFVMLFALFYFFRDGDSILDRLRLALPFEEITRERMLLQAHDLIFASVTISLVIAAAQGVVCGAAFAIVGLSSPVFWGVVMAFLSLLPIIGSWPVWITAAVWLFSTGHAGRAVILIAICGGLATAIDNILRPVILGGRSSLNGLLVFISVLGGIAVFGLLGIILGPIVVATAVSILDVYSGKDVKRTAAGAAEA